MLEVAGTPGERADLLATLAAIDEGIYRPERPAANMDARAKRSHAMLAELMD